MEPVLERWDRSPDLAVHGVGFLLYGLLDVVVDGYFDAVQAFDDFYDEISEGIFSETPLQPSQQRHWFQMRRALVRFHRLVVPMREAVSGLDAARAPPSCRGAVPLLPGRVRPRPAGRASRPTPCGTSSRTIVETNLSLRDYRTNQIMKKVTSWAAIIAVPDADHRVLRHERPLPGLR